MREEMRRGDMMEVVAGKKYPIGAKGELIWWGPGHYRMRALIALEGGKVYIDLRNLKNLSLEARIEAAEAAANAKREVEKAYIAKYLDMEKIESKPAGSSGWRDNSIVTVGLKEPGASDEEIAKAVSLAFPTGSSWGALRWRAGIYNITPKREAGVVEFEESIGLAD